jgi:hypothetical protein
MRIEYLFVLPLLAALAITTLPVFASTGMSGEEHGGGVDNPQPDRVGSQDDEPDSVGSEDDDGDEANRDGPGGEDDNTPEEEDDDPETPQQDDANCWGQTTSDVVEADVAGDDDDSIGGETFGQHAANPTGDDDRDTPREGVGNQDEDHPSDHADEVGDNFGSDEECIDED